MTDIAKIYKNRFEQTGLVRRDRVWKVLCKHFFNYRVPENATILDLACGYGEFINNIRAGRKGTIHTLAYLVNLPETQAARRKLVIFGGSRET